MSLYPSMANWCALAMRSIALWCANFFVMSAPKRNPAPRGERPHPDMSARQYRSKTCQWGVNEMLTVWIGPQQITHRTVMRYFLLAINSPYLYERKTTGLSQQAFGKKRGVNILDRCLVDWDLNLHARRTHDRLRWLRALSSRRPHSTSAKHCCSHTSVGTRRKNRRLGLFAATRDFLE